MIKKYSSIIFLALLFSCSEDDQSDHLETYASASNKINSIHEVNFIRKEIEPIINEELTHRFQKMSTDYLWGDSVLIYPFENKIYHVNLNSGALRVVEIPEYEVRNDIIYAYPISMDSILTIQRMPPVLMINDSKGKVLYKETLPFFDFDVDNLWWKTMNLALDKGSFNYNLQPLRSIYYDHKKKWVYIPFLPVDYIFLDKVENAQTIGAFDLEKKDWQYGLGAAQGLMRFRGDKNYTGIFDRNYFLVKGDTTYLTYPISHHAFLLDTESGELIDEVIASPIDADAIPEPVEKELVSSSDFVRLNEWQSESPFYSELAYHKSVNLFSRIYFHKKSVIDGFKGSYWEDRKTILLIFDNDLNLIKEIDLDPKVFELWRFIPTSKGYLVSEMNLQKELENSDVIKLGYTAEYILDVSEN